ncbi:MAG: hypothetical protein ACI8SE_002123 [Bacteroidia bacterium]|jgi:hypothetical protein
MLLNKYPNNVLVEVAENLANFEYLSLRVKANYSKGDNSNSFAMNVKMQKDSFVWVSVVAVIEVARAYITTDSFTVIDRINRKYYTGAISDLKQFTGQDLSLNQLQNMLIANPLYAVDAFKKYNDELRKDHLKYQSTGLINRVQLSGCFRSMNAEFSSSENADKVEVDYANFTKEKDVGYLPQQVTIDANGNGKKFTFLMEYSSISTTPFDPIIFKIPSKYENGN